MYNLLQRCGAFPVHVPLIKQRSLHTNPPAEKPDLVLISSPVTAHFAKDLLNWLSSALVIAIGPKTETSLTAIGVKVRACGKSGAEDAIQLLQRLYTPNMRVWHVGAKTISPSLEAAFQGWGEPYFRWMVYETVAHERAGDMLAKLPPIDVATFASGSTLQVWKDLSGTAKKLVVIGDSTYKRASQLGIEVHGIAVRPTMEELVKVALSVGNSC